MKTKFTDLTEAFVQIQNPMLTFGGVQKQYSPINTPQQRGQKIASGIMGGIRDTYRQMQGQNIASGIMGGIQDTYRQMQGQKIASGIMGGIQDTYRQMQGQKIASGIISGIQDTAKEMGIGAAQPEFTPVGQAGPKVTPGFTPTPFGQIPGKLTPSSKTSTPSPRLPVPTGVQQSDWNKLDPKRQQEYMDNESKIAARQQYKPGRAVTPENTGDYLNAVDRWGQQARASGEDIGVVRNREIAKQIAAQKKAADAQSAAEAQGRMDTAYALGAKAGIKGNTIEVIGKTVEMERSLRAAGIDPATATPQQLAQHKDAYEKNKAARAKIDTETAAKQIETMRNRNMGGKITTRQGEEIDVDALKQQDPSTMDEKSRLEYERKVRRSREYFSGKQSEYEAEQREKQRQKNREDRLRRYKEQQEEDAIRSGKQQGSAGGGFGGGMTENFVIRFKNNSLKSLLNDAFDPKNPLGLPNVLVPGSVGKPQPPAVTPSGPYVPTPGGVKPQSTKPVTPPITKKPKPAISTKVSDITNKETPQILGQMGSKTLEDLKKAMSSAAKDPIGALKAAGSLALTPSGELASATSGRLADQGFSRENVNRRMEYYQKLGIPKEVSTLMSMALFDPRSGSLK